MARDDIIKKLNKSFSLKKCSIDEIEAITSYTNSSYELFSLAAMADEEKKNKALINKRKLLEKLLRLPISDAAYVPKSILEVFKSMIEKSSTSCELILYRGTSFKHFFATNILNNDPSFNLINKDVVYESLTYVSSTLDLKTALKFTSKKDPLIIEYHLPKNFKALWVEPISKLKENELILMKNQFFQITDICSVDRYGNQVDSNDNNYICVKPVKGLNI